MIGEKWMKWTLLEALIRNTSAVFQKIVGGAVSLTSGHLLYVTALIGCVQAIFGYTVARKQSTKILASREEMLGAIIFGVLAVISTMLGFLTFLDGGELGIRVFIVSLSIIPGMLIDKFFFGKSLSLRQHLGITVAIVAAYAILNKPSLAEIIAFPTWVWFAFANMLSVAINQGVTQKIKNIDPMVKNFWGGLTAIILGCGGMIYFDSFSSLIQYEKIATLSWTAFVIGLLVVALWTVNLFSYKEGAYISLKKVLMNGSYLTMALVTGVIFFGETLSGWQISGVFLYITAFALVDDSTWVTIATAVVKKKSG